MKQIKKAITWEISCIIIGVILIGLEVLGIVKSGALVASCGSSILAISLIMLFRNIRIIKSPKHLKEYEIKNTEERIVYLATKAGNCAFRLLILVLWVALLVSAILGYSEYVQFTSYFILGGIFIYIIAYICYEKKN